MTYREPDNEPTPARAPTEAEASIATQEHEAWGNWRIGVGLAMAFSALVCACVSALTSWPRVVALMFFHGLAFTYVHYRAEEALDIRQRWARAPKKDDE